MISKEEISGIEGVTSPGNAAVNLPVNRRYFGIKLYASGTIASVAQTAEAIIDTVTLVVNGANMGELTAAEWRALYLARMKNQMGYTLADDEIPIPFADPSRATVSDEQLTAFDTFLTPTFTLKIKIKTGITNPAITGILLFDFGATVGADGKRRLRVIKRDKVTIVAPGGNHDVVQIQSPENPVQAVFFAGSQVISRVEVKADSNKVHEATKAVNARVLLDYGIAADTFGANSYPVIFDYNGRLGDGLAAKNAVYRITSAAAHTVTAIVETLHDKYE